MGRSILLFVSNLQIAKRLGAWRARAAAAPAVCGREMPWSHRRGVRLGLRPCRTPWPGLCTFSGGARFSGAQSDHCDFHQTRPHRLEPSTPPRGFDAPRDMVLQTVWMFHGRKGVRGRENSKQQGNTPQKADGSKGHHGTCRQCDQGGRQPRHRHRPRADRQVGPCGRFPKSRQNLACERQPAHEFGPDAPIHDAPSIRRDALQRKRAAAGAQIRAASTSSSFW